MNQPSKKGFRTPADFINAANDAPAEHVPINPAGKSAEALTAIPDATAHPAVAPAVPELVKSPRKAKDVKPAENSAGGAISDAQPHAHMRATDAEKEAPVPAKPAPWDETGLKDAGYTFRMTGSLHAKLAWIADNVPKHKSIQVTLEKAVTAYVDDLIGKHYKPEADD